MKKLGLMMLMAVPAVAAAPADVDVTGTWSIAGDVSGVTVVETCNLKQGTDAKIVGSCDTSTGKYETTGSVANGTATFKHGGSYEGNPLTITYTGKLGTDGLITGTMYVDTYDATGSFTAKRAGVASGE
jgi:hypothetical protein